MSEPVESPTPEHTSSNRSRSSRSNNAANPNATERGPQTYGYHNTFHTHAQPPLTTPPPTYACANNPKTLRHLNEKAREESQPCPLPPYTCTVEMAGPLGVKQELSSPFQAASFRDWNDVYVVLRGTQLSLYRIKSPKLLSKTKALGPGRLIKHFSLQHAEIGVAADFKKTSPNPKSPFAHLVPASTRQKLFETDPHLFEPIREHAIRLRLETEQFLLCAASQEEMLDWVEALCAALDISNPLEDRSEPRYRSLPRRGRRQRMLDGGRVTNLDNLSSLEAGRIIIAEQERILRRLYPHLAGTESNDSAHTGDPDNEDLDPEDVRFPSVRRTASHNSESDERPSSSTTTDSSADPKYAHSAHRHTPAQTLRYRRRCAPILLTNSPRVSDVVFSEGKRMRINVKEHILTEYTSHPPRYDAHNFPKQKELPRIDESTGAKSTPVVLSTQRPAPTRFISDDSFMSFGYDLPSTPLEHPTSSAEGSINMQSAPSSEPPSPTAATHAKAGAPRRLVSLGKTRTNDERGDGLSAVALGVGLLI